MISAPAPNNYKITAYNIDRWDAMLSQSIAGGHFLERDIPSIGQYSKTHTSYMAPTFGRHAA